MKNLKLLVLATLSLVFFISCNDDNEYGGTAELNYVSFETVSMNLSLPVGTSETVSIKAYSTKETGSDRTIMISASEDSTLDPAAYSLPESITIPANSNVGELVFEISDINFGFAATLIVDFMTADGLFIGESIQIDVEKICSTPVIVDFTFDGYASECTWDIKDSSNNIVISGGPWADGTASASVEICLGNGDYTLTAYDAWGDGLTWPNVGNIAVSYNGVELVVLAGDYGPEGSVPFTVAD